MHRPERAAARYLAGDLDPAQAADYDRHLLGCERCWAEVRGARAGRAATEGAREVAPARLRERVRLELEAAAGAGGGSPERVRRGRPVRLVAVAGLVAALLAGAMLGGSALGGASGSADAPALQAAVADFRAGALPGRQVPERTAPDLSALQLAGVGAGGGSYVGLAVDGYAYRQPGGGRIAVYLSDQPFPEAAAARHPAGATDWWVAREAGLTLLCARRPRALLVVGPDDGLVRRAAAALGVR